MSTIPDVDALREEFRKKKEALANKWAKTVDENGTFVAVFGDPAITPYATRVEVGFTEEDEVYVDLQPASELEGGLEDSDFMELESIAYTEAKFLDKDIPKFCSAIYDYLHGASGHKCFDFTEYKALKVAEKTFKDAEERRKAYNAEHSHERKPKETHLQFYVKWEASFVAANGNKAKQAELLEKLRIWESVGGARRENRPTPEDVQAYGDLVSRIISKSGWSPIFTYTYKKLTEVPLIIRRLAKIEELNLSYNSIVVIPQEMTNFQHLRKLIICGNKIKFLPPLSGLPNLEVLDAHSNEIIAFPTDIQHLKYLQTIDLERNQIVVVPAELSTLDRLSFLNLNRNNIKLVPPQLGYLSNLSYFKLAHNPIVNLPAHVYLQGNAASLAYLREYIPEAAHITESSLVSDISKYFDTELFSDVIFRSKEGRSFFAHRLIIDARCAQLYKQILDIESDINDAAAALAQSSISDKGASSSAPISAASSHTSSVASVSGKRLYDAQHRLIVDVELSDMELEYLLKFIYGDVFEPERPKLVETEKDMKPEEAARITALNGSSLAAYYSMCKRIGALGEKYVLPRFAQLAYQQASPSEKVPATTFFKDFDLFSLRPKHSDVSFEVEGRTIMTHKIILCARSEYFKNMLTSGLLESTLEVIPIADVTYPVMRSILKFCYDDDVTCTSETVMDLLMSSRVYGIERLKGMVETIVGYSLDPSNAPGIYSIAELYAFKRLKKACKYFVLSNWNTVTTTPAWGELPPELVDKLTLKAKNWKIVV